MNYQNNSGDNPLSKKLFKQYRQADTNFLQGQEQSYTEGKNKLRNRNRKVRIGLGLWLGAAALGGVQQVAHVEVPSAVSKLELGAALFGGSLAAGQAMNARNQRKELTNIADRTALHFKPYTGDDPSIITYAQTTSKPDIPEWMHEGMSDQARNQLADSIELHGTPEEQAQQIPLLRPKDSE